MKKRRNISIAKEQLVDMQTRGFTQQEMAKDLQVSVSVIERRIKLYELTNYSPVRYDLMTIDNPQFCYLLGWFCSDGYLSKTNRVSIRTYEYTPMKALANYFQTRLVPVISKAGKTSWDCNFSKAPDIFSTLFTIDKTRTVQVPELPLINVPYFIRGVIEGDGCIRPAGKCKSTLLRVFTASSRFAIQFQQLVQSLGFKCRLRPDRMGWELSTDSLDFCTYIYQGLEEFVTPRKQSRVQEWLSL